VREVSVFVDRLLEVRGSIKLCTSYGLVKLSWIAVFKLPPPTNGR